MDEMLARKLNLPLEKITLERNRRAHRRNAHLSRARPRCRRQGNSDPRFHRHHRHAAVQRRDSALRAGAGGDRLGAAGSRRQSRCSTSASTPTSKNSGTTTRTRRCREVYQFVMAQAHGDLRTEFSPPFDTLKLDIHLSEPDYSLDLDKERISSLEALQEDTLLLHRRLHEHDGRPGNRPADRLHRPHHPDRARFRRRQGWPRAHRILRQARRQSAGAPDLDRRAGQASQTGAQSARAHRRDPAAPDSGAREGRRGGRRAADLDRCPPISPRTSTTSGCKVEGQDQVDRSIFSRGAGARPVALARSRCTRPASIATSWPIRTCARWRVEFDLPLPLAAKPDTPAPREFARFRGDAAGHAAAA